MESPPNLLKDILKCERISHLCGSHFQGLLRSLRVQIQGGTCNLSFSSIRTSKLIPKRFKMNDISKYDKTTDPKAWNNVYMCSKRQRH